MSMTRSRAFDRAPRSAKQAFFSFRMHESTLGKENGSRTGLQRSIVFV